MTPLFDLVREFRPLLQQWPFLWTGIAVLCLSLLYYIVLKISNKTILRFLRSLLKKSKLTWDDYLIEKGAVTAFVGLLPLLAVYSAVS